MPLEMLGVTGGWWKLERRELTRTIRRSSPSFETVFHVCYLVFEDPQQVRQDILKIDKLASPHSTILFSKTALLTGRPMSWLLLDPSLVPIYLFGYILVFFSPNDMVYKALNEVPYFSTPFYQDFFHHVINSVSRTGAVSGAVDASASRETCFVIQGMPFKNPRVSVLPQIFLGTIAATFGGMCFKWWFVEAWASPSYSLWVVYASVAWYVWAVDLVDVLEPFVQGGAELNGDEEVSGRIS
ncbi:hypothetical protein BJ742DRAFT_382953 [Cladochytrium replicatum]|nr:hypothetical protein BJ742DRAFT_382953 [Cladochytrium replicatum]